MTIAFFVIITIIGCLSSFRHGRGKSEVPGGAMGMILIALSAVGSENSNIIIGSFAAIIIIVSFYYVGKDCRG